MKKHFLFAILFISTSIFAQKIESVEINGSKYYVYPYGREVKLSRTLENLVDNECWFPPNASKAEKKKIQKICERQNYNPSKDQKARDLLVLQNSDRFYQTDFNLDSDIVPPLDQLPDGKYVQYYIGYERFDENKKAIVETRIAGYFELKNNLLEGNAYWLNIIGDTVKKGQFHHGLKEGTWTLSTFSHKVYRSKRDVEIFLNAPQTYKTYVKTYVHGIVDGPYALYEKGKLMQKGFYKDGRESGEWFIYSQAGYYEGLSPDSVVLVKHFTYAEKEIISHKYFVRESSGSYSRLPEKYYTFPKNTYFEKPTVDISSLWKIAFGKPLELDLPEEEINAYEGEDYGQRDGFEMEDMDIFYADFVEGMGYWIDDQFITKQKMIDSIGTINKYDGIYEQFYTNGQLKVRLEYKNGELVSEDTIFWDNGKPADVIVYDPITKEYENRLLDYTGVAYEINLYDSSGTYIHQVLDPFYKDKHIPIEGFDATVNYGQQLYVDGEPFVITSFEYENFDTLSQNDLKGKITFFKSWYMDTSSYRTKVLDADERIMTSEVRSLNHNLKEQSVFEFDEGYNKVRGTSTYYFNALKSVNTFNGDYISDSRMKLADSFPTSRAIYPEDWYDLTSDNMLYYKNQPYNGKITFNPAAKKMRLSVSKNSIKVDLCTKRTFYDGITKDYFNYLKTGKTKYNDILSLSRHNLNYTSALNELFPFMEHLMRSNNRNMINKVEGHILNGKPSGTWKAYDKAGKVLLEYNFLKGELHGKSKIYNYKYPKTNTEINPRSVSPYDSFPSKKIYYLLNEKEYKNGMESGSSKTYDWQGKVIFSNFFKDGLQEGPAFERNSIASTYFNYENGSLDGIVRTQLHLPGKDSILLYELNFQNGLLQGESRSYHTNGKLSKRGFFLHGRPIDDYEGYDSLGYRFHYVKFLYSFPVEEKIWEANELSVRYQFDWRDSIYFRPTDITQATSVSNLLYKYGLLGNQYKQPYYGRPSLVNKEGINYHMTKYFPNDTVSRDGALSAGKKVGCWQFYAYDGEKLYEVEYFDTILKIGDSIQFKSKGMLFDYDKAGNLLSKSYIIEKYEKYDCSHTDHYEVRQFYTIWQAHDSLHRINGYNKNYYDNGVLQSEGNMKNGLPTGIWKYYDPFGKLNHVGEYKNGKRDGRWLSGDLSKSKYMGDICMNPNLPDLEEQMKYQEKILDLYIRYFKMGKLLNSEYYGLNLNDYESENQDEQTPEK